MARMSFSYNRKPPLPTDSKYLEPIHQSLTHLFLKNLGYRLLKLWIKSGLYLYYKRIKISGLENVPKNKPVLFLPNHQAALMDVLLIVTNCNRKPFFLTRSDVFRHPKLIKFFTYLQMLPIYRFRDGRESLAKNQAVFDRCARLFQENRAIVLFPEANHSMKRRVRPLSKGFTRILFNALDKRPGQEIHLVPVGLNYVNNTGFPDKVALYYGKSIVVNPLYEAKEIKASVENIKKEVSEGLQDLTTHIADEKNYDRLARKLDGLHPDYLNPSATNALLENLKTAAPHREEGDFKGSTKARDALPDTPRPGILSSFFKWIFVLLNLPIVALWRTCVKPKVWEPEFTSTLRFGFALLVYPFYYLILFAVVTAIGNAWIGATGVVGLFLFNWAYVRFN